ncbi:unnamed protein product [Nippostrongylus brasiliensis]|uniref:Protein bunched, class 1/class 3/D/E (inferred by orthology to a D. melanogaster protein) n=1 Tax=Nippostrongylus brasiliensis TaxID=27835 RepID=A0A0N4XTG9_NIPBR|nr:unnamed protein product [Nippostrongylus brasiliensis]
MIVPLESKYARGRWNCFDYYDKETSKVPRTRVSESGESRRVSPAHGRSVRSLNSDLSLQGAVHHSTNPTIAFDDSSESDRENNEVFARSTPAFSRTSAPPQVATIPNSNDNVAAMNIKRVPSRSNRKSTDERLQRGLESSLAPHEIRSRMNPKRYDLLSG